MAKLVLSVTRVDNVVFPSVLMLLCACLGR